MTYVLFPYDSWFMTEGSSNNEANTVIVQQIIKPVQDFLYTLYTLRNVNKDAFYGRFFKTTPSVIKIAWFCTGGSN